MLAALLVSLAVMTPGADDLPLAVEPISPPVASEKESHAYRWIQSDADADQVHLYDSRTQVGTYRRQSGNYYEFNGTDWASKPTSIPKGTPKVPKAKPKAMPPPRSEEIVEEACQT